ncbi:hypothetical protein A9HBioS_3459 [Pseudomonas koreensis]|uniref:Uncharacterized protein n=1 Tax=Pseudomonas koreensis TaxID=198620 RepID=A0AA94ELF6_9PSED|nr:hypothetical protein A9HBioS_3459 [Pseudomonas koreensis]
MTQARVALTTVSSINSVTSDALLVSKIERI